MRLLHGTLCQAPHINKPQPRHIHTAAYRLIPGQSFQFEIERHPPKTQSLSKLDE